jgi:hypothetical protein
VKDLYLAYGTDEKLGAAIFQQWRYNPNDPNTLWAGDADGFVPDPNDPNQTDSITAAIEFRYESGRRRHLLRNWDPHDRTDTAYWTAAGAFVCSALQTAPESSSHF